MHTNKLRVRRRVRRKKGIRKTLQGTTERPRLTIFRSANHIYAQIIDDLAGMTLVEASTRNKDLRGDVKYGGNVEAAKLVGKSLAEKAKAKNIEVVSFDRNGYRFHGRVRGLADAAREAGLKF